MALHDVSPGLGSIIGVTQYGPATIADYSVTTTGTPAALDTTNMTVSFEVPANGAVVVRFEASIAPATSAGVIAVALLNHSGGAQIGNTLDNIVVGTNTARVHLTWYLTGLSLGSLGLDIAAGVTGGTAHVYAQGHTGAANTGKVGPAVIVVQAA